MSYTDFDIDTFQDYLEQKCVLNKLIAHNKVTDNCPNGQRTFSRFESEEHILQIQNNAGENILIVADVYGQRAGAPDDKRIRYTVQLRFAVKKKSGSGDNQDAINEAVKKAEKIMFQFVNVFEKEAEEGCNELEGYEPMETRWDKIEEQPWLDDYYGWDLNISFLSYLHAYDAADWEEET